MHEQCADSIVTRAERHTDFPMDRAKKDRRFLEALEILESKLVNGKIVVERPNPKLAGFAFCKKGEPSGLGTERYHEIIKNLGINY